MKGHPSKYFNAIFYKEKIENKKDYDLQGLMKKNLNFDHSNIHKLILV
jgi:hypothetical protein